MIEPGRTREQRIEEALAIIGDWGSLDGADHKQWVLNQVVRALSEDEDAYSAWVVAYSVVGMIEWDVGTAP